MIHFTRSIAEGLRLEKIEGVYIYTVCPTFTETPMMVAMSPASVIERSRGECRSLCSRHTCRLRKASCALLRFCLLPAACSCLSP